MGEKLKRQSLINGAIILAGCLMITKFMGIFFRIPVQNLIGDEGMGYFQMSYPIYFLFTAFASGVPISISKMVSEYVSQGNYSAIRVIVRKTLSIFLISTCIMSFLLVFFGQSIVRVLNWHENSYYAYIVTAIAPIFVIVLFTLRGVFQGLSIMTPSGVSQIIEQFGRVAFGVGLAYVLFPLGVKYAAAGAAFGTVVGAMLAVIYLFFKYIKVMKDLPADSKSCDEKEIKNKILDNALPISLAAGVMTLIGLIDNLIVPSRLIGSGFDKLQTTILFGQTYGKAATLNNVPLALTAAICASIVPSIAGERYKGVNEVNKKIDMAIRLSAVIALPATFGLYYMSYPIMEFVFLGSSEGYELLKYFAISMPFIILYHTTTSILQSLDRFDVPIKSIVVSIVAKFCITYILTGIPSINIAGAVIGSGVAYFIASMINSVFLFRKMKVKINFYESLIKPFIASAIMIIIVVITYNYIYNYTISNSVATVVSIGIGVVAYSIFIVIFKVFTYKDLKIRVMSKNN